MKLHPTPSKCEFLSAFENSLRNNPAVIENVEDNAIVPIISKRLNLSTNLLMTLKKKKKTPRCNENTEK